MFADSHCHLNYPGLVEQLGAVLARARAAGVSQMLNISTRASEWDDVISIAEGEDDVMASIGIHPHEADGHADIGAEQLIAKAANPNVAGIGETGLDYHYDHSDRARQRASFREHIKASRETGLPLIVHTREAEADTESILGEEMGKGTFPALIHCFTGTLPFARRMLELGLTISFSGIVTFKNAEDLRDVARAVPLDRLLIETDSPFLAPVPHRGQTCEPAFVADTARFLAELRWESLDQLAAATSANYRRLFRRAAA
jgi:TatD DNase family protein